MTDRTEILCTTARDHNDLYHECLMCAYEQAQSRANKLERAWNHFFAGQMLFDTDTAKGCSRGHQMMLEAQEMAKEVLEEMNERLR